MTQPYKLVYISTATGELLAEELYDIIKVSNINNSKHDITGVLLFKGGMFLQVLEGPKDYVVDLYYNTIVNDKRHRDPTVVIEGYDNKRTFPDWHMHPNTFDSRTFISEEELANDSDLKVLDIVNRFDKSNY